MEARKPNWEETNNVEDTEEPRYSPLLDVYDYWGRPITTETWGTLFSNLEYKRVALTWLPGGHKYVSTVWLGLNHSFSDSGPPLIFESMVFSNDGPWMELGGRRRKSNPDLDMWRYSTVEQARVGHQALVKYWRLNRKQRRRQKRKDETKVNAQHRV